MIHDFIVVGGGIGGCSIAALLNAKGYDVLLLEKEPTLGGCASTFVHSGYRYNTGATTLSGYHQEGIVRGLFESIGVTPNLLTTDPSITIIQGDKICRRYRDVEKFITEVESLYPHPKNGEFWRLIHQIGESFYAMEGHYYSNKSLFSKIRSLLSFFPMLREFFPYLRGNGYDFIHKFYGSISPEYLDFLDAQILIVTQATSQNVNFFTAALALGYTFNETHYPLGGMGALCDSLTSKLSNIHTQCRVNSITRTHEYYHLSTSKGLFKGRNLIMGTSHYDNGRYFDDHQIQKYYQRYQNLNNYQSAFCLYMTLKTDKKIFHHYQLIASEVLPNTLSKSLFVSFSDPADTTIAPQGYYSVTASIHTDSRWWLGISPTQYKERKQTLHNLLQSWICDTLMIQSDEIVECFAATPKTFGRYLNRTQLGGNALSISNILPRLPANDTPIKGLYHVGDTAYAAQGWPGVVMGAINCARSIDG